MMDEQEGSLISPWTPEWCSVCEADVGYAKWRVLEQDTSVFDPKRWEILYTVIRHNECEAVYL